MTTWAGVLTVAVIIVVVVALVWLTVLALTRATRLHRLHVRVDLARASLIASLDRRAVVVRSMAAAYPDSPSSAELVEAADLAEAAEFADREAVENRLSTVIAKSDPYAQDPYAQRPALTAELAQAQARVTIARRFYNDAVRDARTLGQRRMVRWFRLGGHAQLPEYFEITERVSVR